jgi:type IV secretory pathway VirB2 component (pilin)
VKKFILYTLIFSIILMADNMLFANQLNSIIDRIGQEGMQIVTTWTRVIGGLVAAIFFCITGWKFMFDHQINWTLLLMGIFGIAIILVATQISSAIVSTFG